jgi:WD40 repeat protein
MTADCCPEPAQLQELINDALDAEVEARLITHLDTCASCRQKLELLAGEGFCLPEPVAKPSPESEPALAAVVAQLQEESGEGGAARVAESVETQILSFLAPPAQPEHLGRLGHYEVLAIVGRGGMGIVFKARDETLDRIVAIKVMAPQLAASATARRRFDREARAAAAIRDEHVIGIHAVGEENGLPYLVMEYIHGVTLQERLNRKGPVEMRQVLRIGMQMAKGLAAAHAQGLIHRDIKPANILLENGVERVKISDFGLARAVDDASLTQSGIVAGTPEYMAPEQASGEAVDQRADLFSLGSVLYAMCAGRPPFRARGSLAVLKRVCEDTPRPLREINPDLPEWLGQLIAKLHAKKPADRFNSAGEVADLLRRGLSGSPPSIPFSDTEDARSPRKRRLLWLAVAVSVLLLAVALTLGLTAKRLLNPAVVGGQMDGGLAGETKVEDAPMPRGDPAAAEATARKLKKALIGHTAAVISVAYSPDSQLLASGDGAGEARVWNMPSGTLRYVLPARGLELYTLAFSPDGKSLVTACTQKNMDIYIWDAKTGKPDGVLKGHTKGIYEVSFAPDGETLVSAGWDAVVRVWDFAARREVRAVPSPEGLPIRSVVVSAGGRIAVGNGKVSLLEADGQLVKTFDWDAAPLCFSPDGRLLAGTTWMEGRVTVLDLKSGEKAGSWHAHEGLANGVSFSRDGRALATAGSDGFVRLWDVVTQRQLAELPHEGQAYQLAFSPDGDTLATTGKDNRLVKLWDVSFLRSSKATQNDK